MTSVAGVASVDHERRLFGRPVPRHWETRRAKYLFQRVQRPAAEDDEVVTAFRDGVVTLRSRRRESGFTNALKEIGYQGVRRGDLVIHAMDGFAGAIGVSEADGKCSPVYSCCRVHAGMDARYYAYLLRSLALTGFISSLAKGIRERSTDFRWADLSVLELPCPPASVQHEIAAFLDRETARIDALIEKKQRLIELLEEKRQVVIVQAVTRGLDPDVPMKDSGVEWIGRIPTSWSVVRFKQLVLGSNAGEVIDRSYWGDGEELLYTCQRTPERCHFPDFPEWKRTKSGELLLTRNGTPYIHVPAPNSIYSNVVQRCRLRRETASRFIRYALAVVTHSIGGYGVSIESFSYEKWKELKIALPESTAEQLRISDFLESVGASYDTLTLRITDSIQLLRERRSALIIAAVTGQIDITEAA